MFVADFHDFPAHRLQLQRQVYAVVRRGRDAHEVAAALWRDFQRGERAEMPPFLRPHLPEVAPAARRADMDATSGDAAGAARQLRRAQAAALDAFRGLMQAAFSSRVLPVTAAGGSIGNGGGAPLVPRARFSGEDRGILEAVAGVYFNSAHAIAEEAEAAAALRLPLPPLCALSDACAASFLAVVFVAAAVAAGRRTAGDGLATAVAARAYPSSRSRLWRAR